MIYLDYTLSPLWNGKLRAADLRTVDQGSLRYDLFLGDVYLRINGADFSAPWGWVPVLDFSLAVRDLVDKLSPEGEDSFEFTESEAALRFQRRDADVEVLANYAPAVAKVPYGELREAARAFADRVIGDLLRTHPELKENVAFGSLGQVG